MTEFWLISAPNDRSNQQTWERMQAVTTKSNLSNNFKFAIPDIKVGNLDLMITLTDELGKLDIYTESVLKKIAQYTAETMEDSKDRIQENLLANGVDLVTYVTRFQWDMAKYPIKQSLVNLIEVISKQISQIESDFKSRSLSYNNLKGNLQSKEKKAVGNLLTCTLTDFVKKDDFVLDSEYLTTLLVVVSKTNYGTWLKTYESLTDLVVPQSTKKIMEDSEGGLFTVTLFKKAVEDFKIKARENKFVVREFNYNEKELNAEKAEIARLAADKKQQYGPLLRWLKVNFSEAFIGWIHIKALRVFVESVLRYGLPVNFQAVLLQPSKKQYKRLREVLNAVFKHLDGTAATSVVDYGMEIPGLNIGNQEYYSYVYFKIDLNMIDH
ncbi:V-type proton ATPase subunit C 1-A [Polypterus senegalus]|uniref:V-type proton ATPase subunit C 1-A n=1 Tax=Polypterus senegalus TaxID=55291 RepID=UPI001964A0B4|nr:V-type proton ATPase subunit C 1-A [Polypterus senegalus]XP_039604834.1 V-type proton ATPase subunit C 1-A [Polypterus senegalus]